MSAGTATAEAAADSGQRNWLLKVSVAEWVLYALTAAVCAAALCHDFRRAPLVGDQASHLMQILSITYDFDLRYGGEDLARWHTIGWTNSPEGVIYRIYSGGAAFAKPYGYSAFVASFTRVAGVRFGVAIASCAILLCLIVLLFKMARLHFNRATAALLVLATVFASNAYFYVFPVHPDLFHSLLSAAVCYAALRHMRAPNDRWLMATAILVGASLSEKLSMFFLLVPVFAAAVAASARWRNRLIAIGLAIATFAVCVLPYLHYTDYRTLSAYGGTRIYSGAGVVVAPGETSDRASRYQAQLRGLHAPLREIIRSTYYSFLGAYTGILVFAPAAILFAVASIWLGENRRRLLPWLIGIGLLIVSGLIYNPWNYYGGEGAVGNRWFITALPLALVLPVVTSLRPAIANRVAVSAIVLSAIFISSHHLDPVNAFVNCDQAGWVQRFFPVEINQRFIPGGAARKYSLLNISLVPQPPRWRCFQSREPQTWLWRNGEMVQSPCRIRYGREYLKSGDEPMFAVFEQTGSHIVYASYEVGLLGNFVLDRKRSSLVVSCAPGQEVRLWLLPASDATTTAKISRAGWQERLLLPAMLTFVSPNEVSERLNKFDIVADDYLRIAPVADGEGGSGWEHPVELR